MFRSGWLRVRLRRLLYRRLLGGRRLLRTEYGGSADRLAIRHNRERERRHHKEDCRPGGGARKNRRRAARAEGSLAAGAAECGCDVRTLAALQQHDDDEEDANDNVNNGKQDDHELSLCAAARTAEIVRQRAPRTFRLTLAGRN